MQKKLRVLTRELEERRATLRGLEAQLAQRGLAAGGLRAVLALCQAGLARILSTATGQDHLERLPEGRISQLLFLADSGPELPRETKRSVLLAFGARVVLDDGEAGLSLEIPLVTPTGSSSEPCLGVEHLRVAI